MLEVETWGSLIEQFGPVLATIIFVSFMYFSTKKQSKSGSTPPDSKDFSDSQKLWLEKEVVQPVVEAIKEAVK